MKRCNHCGELKDESEFSWRYKYLNERSPTCRSCRSKIDRNYYKSRAEAHKHKVKEQRDARRNLAREFIWGYLASHPCVECGESDPRLLEFDHVQGAKKKTISEMVGQGYSVESIQAEVNKCVVRCVACHRKKTYKEPGWFEG